MGVLAEAGAFGAEVAVPARWCGRGGVGDWQLGVKNRAKNDLGRPVARMTGRWVTWGCQLRA